MELLKRLHAEGDNKLGVELYDEIRKLGLEIGDNRIIPYELEFVDLLMKDSKLEKELEVLIKFIDTSKGEIDAKDKVCPELKGYAPGIERGIRRRLMSDYSNTVAELVFDYYTDGFIGANQEMGEGDYDCF